MKTEKIVLTDKGFAVLRFKAYPVKPENRVKKYEQRPYSNGNKVSNYRRRDDSKSSCTKDPDTPHSGSSDMLNDRKVIKAVDVLPISKALGVSVQDIYDAGKLYQGRCRFDAIKRRWVYTVEPLSVIRQLAVIFPAVPLYIKADKPRHPKHSRAFLRTLVTFLPCKSRHTWTDVGKPG